MSDLTEVKSSLPVEVTDGNLNVAVIQTSVAGTELGVVVREARTGQNQMAYSMPITIASDQPGSLKIENTTHVPGSYGAYIIGLRNDGATNTFTSANTTYSPIAVDAYGRVFVTGSITTAGGGTQTVAGTVTVGSSVATQTIAVSAGTQTVAGTVTTVGGSAPVTQTVAGTVTVGSSVATQTIAVSTGTQTVTGTVTTVGSGGPTTQTVTGTVTTVPPATTTVAGTITAAGVVMVDETAFIQAASPFTPCGGVFNDSATVVSTGAIEEV